MQESRRCTMTTGTAPVLGPCALLGALFEQAGAVPSLEGSPSRLGAPLLDCIASRYTPTRRRVTRRLVGATMGLRRGTKIRD